MQPCSIEWAAGLFEGEGSIYQNKVFGGKYSYPRIQITMSDEDVIRRFSEVVGIPHYSIHKTTKENRKQCWTWRTGVRDEVRHILGMLLPYFGNRRAYTALNILDDLELYHVNSTTA